MDMTTYLLMRDRWGSGSTTVNLQNKSVTPSNVVQYISADSGYDGLSTVTMEAIPSEYIIPSGTISISANGSYNVEAFASAEVLVSGSGGGSNEDAIIDRTISGQYENSRVLSIGRNAFQSCSALTAVSFPAVTSISSYAFTYCTKLTTVSFPAVTTIGDGAFSYCWSLTTASFPVATAIGTAAFASCSSLTTANFSKLTIISTGAFASCIRLTTINFPSVTTINGNAFSNCKSLTTVSFPAATIISTNAFGSCYALTAVSFPAVTTISKDAFMYCRSLMTVSFPAASVIMSTAFVGCYKLLSLYLLGSSYCTLSNINAFSSTPISTYTTSTGGVRGNIFVRESMYSSYLTQTNWTYYSSRFVSLTDEQIAALDA